MARRSTSNAAPHEEGTPTAPGASARGRSRYGGARESGAGDQFHYLFAARRALALLDRSSGLARIRMEGFSPDEPVSVSPDLLLGADLVEYYGGGSFRTADRIVISQLKYSHRQPERAWTAARLGEASGSRGHSVISRLAELYIAFTGNHSRAEVRRKVQLRLVSNQPTSASFRGAVDQARHLIAGSSGPLATDELLNRLDASAAKQIRRLSERAGLDPAKFPDFLVLLDLSETGAAARSIQELQLSAELRKYFPDTYEAATDRLYRTIESEAMPEAERSRGLTRAELLVTFGVDSEAALLPVPARFEELTDPLETPDVARLAAAAAHAPTGSIVAHGDAGVGKTTTLRQLEAALPPGSVVITYDCFGGGSYLDPAEGRHLPERALYQLINELALRCDTPVLLQPPSTETDLWRIFSERAEAAATALRGDGSLLVFAIDAADNAVFAARQAGDRCFVPRLWHLGLPTNAKVVVTARTHRVDDLDAPANVLRCQLLGFGPEESAAYLRLRFPDTDDAAALRFHDNSGGNPRVQFYVLDVERAAELTLDAALADAKRTPANIFNDLVDAAIRHVADPAKATETVANLVSLARPARIATFANATKISFDAALAFCHGLAPGVVIEGDRVSFRDEDFEKHLREVVGEDGEVAAHARLATYFLEIEETDAEAAAVVAEHLFRANDFRQLVDFTLSRGEPLAITDPVVRLHAYRRRLAFALRAALTLGATTDALRLVILAGEAARSGSAIENVVRERPDLAMRYGDTRGVAAIYLRQDNAAWRGPLHLKVAAMYAREGDHAQAAEHFHLAEAWLREAFRRRDDDDDARAWHVTTDDIAAGATTLYWTRGLRAAMRWLRSWRPPEAVLASTAKFSIAIAVQPEAQRLLDEIASMKLSARAEATFLGTLWSNGASIPSERVHELAPIVERALRRSPLRLRRRTFDEPAADEEWAMHFAELAASCRADASQVKALARLASPPLPNHAPPNWDSLSRYDLALRRVTLEAAAERRDLTADDLIPAALQPRDKDEHREQTRKAQERTQFTSVFGAVLPAYKLRARVLTRRTRLRDIEPLIKTQIGRRRDSASSRWATFDQRYPLWARTIADAALRARGGDPRSLLEEIADVAPAAVHDAAPDVWLDLAERALRYERHRHVGFDLADRAATYVEERDLPASERTRTLLRAASLVDPRDAALAHDYYERAVTAAAGVDDDSVTLLELHAEIARRLAPEDQRAPRLAHRLVRLVEVFSGRVSDRERLPHAQTLASIARLHPPTAFAAASRWEDEGRFPIEEAIEPLATAAVDSGFLAPRDGVWLLRIGGERVDPSRYLAPLLNRLVEAGHPARATLTEVTAEIAQWIVRDLPLDSRPGAARRVVEWADRQGVARGAVSQLHELSEYVATFGEDTSAPAHGLRRHEKRRSELPPARAEPSQLAASLSVLTDSYTSDSDIEVFIETAGDAVAPSRRVEFLQALVTLPSDHAVVRWHAEALATSLSRLLHKWRRSVAVQRWAPSGVAAFVEGYFVALVAYAESAARTLRVLLRLPFIGNPSAVLLRGLASHLDDLNAAQLFAIAEATAHVVDDKDVGDILSWSMARLEEADGEPDLPGLPTDADGTLATFLFALFANVDKRTRWRAAHVARAVARIQREPFIDALVAKTSAHECDHFVSPRYPFYWLSARHWLMAVLARIADQYPQSMRIHLDTLVGSAVSTELPHAAIRDLSKRAALSVLRAYPNALDDERVSQLRLANEPRSCMAERKFRYGEGSDRRNQEDAKFHFDSMDTLPYWYAPLGRVFGLAASDVSERSERWIVDVLGFTNDDTYNDRRELSREREYDQLRNDHGSIPVLEVLRTYLEYHGMLLAAGEMCDDGVPVSYDEWDDPPGPWSEWLSRHVATFPDCWIADLRAPTPRERFAYAPLPALDDWLEPGAADFDEQVLISRADGEHWLTVHSYTGLYADDRRSSVHVRAALVAPEMAASLMRAYQSADPTDYFVPYEDADETAPGRAEIEDGDFVLRGLLVRVARERDSLEEHDPLARISYSFDTLGQAFVAASRASVGDKRLVIRGDSEEVIAQTEIWSDVIGDEREYGGGRRTEGERTLVRVPSLLQFLAEQQLDLIIEVQLDRKRRRSERERDDYAPPKHRIYVLRQDGTVETVAGRARARRNDRPRATA